MIIIMDELKEKLKAFGKVEECRVEGDEIFIKLTDGFKNDFKNTNNVLGIVLELLPDPKNTIKKYTVNKNLFDLILKLQSK